MLPTQPEVLLKWLQRRLANITHTVSADLNVNANANAKRQAAVLIGLVMHPNEVTVLLTLRALHLSVHAGQVSFPGGAQESTDSDPIATALRETWEEVGIPADWITPISVLGEYHTISGYCVTPVLAAISPGYPINPDANEVAEVFELPLAVLLDAGRYEKRSVERNGVRGETYFLDYGHRTVWGATAGMLLQLAKNLDLSEIPGDKPGV